MKKVGRDTKMRCNAEHYTIGCVMCMIRRTDMLYIFFRAPYVKRSSVAGRLMRKHAVNS